MRKAICGVLICFSVLCGLNTNAKAIEPSTSPEATPLEVSIMRATGSFNMSIDANKKSKANTSFPFRSRRNRNHQRLVYPVFCKC